MDQLRLTVDASIINAASQATTESALSPVHHARLRSPVLEAVALEPPDREGTMISQDEVETTEVDQAIGEHTPTLPLNGTQLSPHGAGNRLTAFPFTNSLVTDESSYADEIYDVCLEDSQDSSLSDYSRCIRTQAFDIMLQNADGEAGVEISLLSTTGNHSTLEPDLGEF